MVLGKKVRWGLAGGGLLALVAFGWAGASWFSEPSRPPSAFEHRFDLASRYLTDVCQPDGTFIYRLDVNPEVKIAPMYNVLRHAGSIYGMATGYERRPNPELLAAMVRACRVIRTRWMAPPDERPELLAVWEVDDPHAALYPDEAKLGGAALSLLAMSHVEMAAPNTIARKDLRRLAGFICFLQRDDGSFYSKYIPARGGRYAEWESMYYPAQAALALVTYNRIDPSPEWLQAASRGLVYLARHRSTMGTLPNDHWVLLATAALLKECPGSVTPADREVLFDFARALCRQFVDELHFWPKQEDLVGCFTGDGRTCPTATRLEGLQAALRFLPEESEDDRQLRAAIADAVDAGMVFLLRSQILEGRCQGGWPRSTRGEAPDYSKFSGSDAEGFARRAGEVRIDYVQHALSALIAYEAAHPEVAPGTAVGDALYGAPAQPAPAASRAAE